MMIPSSAFFDINQPADESPVVISLPHSGRDYPPQMVAASHLTPLQLRASEDVLVDLLLDFAALKVTALRLKVARAFCDVNRHALELDGRLIEGALPKGSLTKSARVRAGFGVVARCVSEGVDIYPHSLSLEEVTGRLVRVHGPYHQALGQLLAEKLKVGGRAVLLDFHSMPSTVAKTCAGRGVDVVISNQDGAASSPKLLAFLADHFMAHGLKVARNDPFTGGYILERHANPKSGIEGVQIEINRALYVDEKTYEPHSGFTAMAQILQSLITRGRTFF